MRNRIASALSVVFLALAALPAAAQNQAWIRQFGTIGDEGASAAAPDGSGGVYSSGWTSGSLGGPNAGYSDAWLARYDSAGNQTWIRQLGTSSMDLARAAAPDGSGGAYLAGETFGSLGGPNAGNNDAWLAHYDSAGNQTWIRQLGTSAEDAAFAVASDELGGVYLGGWTSGSLGGPNAGGVDVWLARYDSAGSQTWIRHVGSNCDDFPSGAVPDGTGGVYLSGDVYSGSLGGPSAGGIDAWLARYDSAGNQVWIRQFGTSGGDCAGGSTSPDGSGGVYVSGFTQGSLGGANAGDWDAWLARYDSGGNQTWIRQFGTTCSDFAIGDAPDGSGGVYVSGHTYDCSFGGPSSGGMDAWLAHYDSAGNQLWIRQLGTSGTDYAYVAVSDGNGGVYAGGATSGSLGAPNLGGYDAWLARYEAPCGTISSYCTAGTTTHGCVPPIAGSGVASASAGSGFTISVSHVEGAQSGLIFYGLSGAVAFPWGTSTSFLCVKSPLERTPVQNSGGTYNACNGALALDWNLYIASSPLALGNPFAGGEVVRAQAWFRDPPSPKTSNLSNGLQFSVCP